MATIQSGYLKTKNGTQLMTTVPYPVGAIYLSVDSTNPSKLFGGTWQQIAKGRTLVGVDTSQAEFNTVKKTGGNKTHSHSQGSSGSTVLTVDQMPAHDHLFKYYQFQTYGGGTANGIAYNITNTTYVGQDIAGMQKTGGNKGHTHTNPNTNASSSLQPYYTCYIWLRTA